MGHGGGGLFSQYFMQFSISCRKMLRRPRGPDLISALSIGDLLITEASRGILCTGLPSPQIAKWAGGRCCWGGGGGAAGSKAILNLWNFAAASLARLVIY